MEIIKGTLQTKVVVCENDGTCSSNNPCNNCSGYCSHCVYCDKSCVYFPVCIGIYI